MISRPPLRQSLALRIVYRRTGRHALAVRVTIRNSDLYMAFNDKSGELLRESYHQSGMSHTYVFDESQREINPPKQPLQRFRGVKRMWSAAPDPDDLQWSYDLRSNRTNLVVDLDRLNGVTPTVDLWLIERGGASLLVDLMTEYRTDAFREPIDWKAIDSTQPWVLVVVWKLRQGALDSIRDVTSKLGWPANGTISGFVG